MQNPSDIRKQITAQIIAALEQNLVPWRRPWTARSNAGRPGNVLSRKVYSGINPLLLEVHAHTHGFQSRWWGTFRQWQDLGGMVSKRPDHVSPGHWGAQIVFYKPISRTITDPETGDETKEQFRILRTFTVFNADQVQGDAVDRFKVTTPVDQPDAVPDFAPAEQLITASNADIRCGGDRAFYVRPTPDGSWPNHADGDYIQMPHRRQFVKPGAYYETAAHELAHHSEVRLGWDHKAHGYAMGELVAEMTGCMLAAELRIPHGEDLNNHVAYLKSWLDAMKGDPSFIFKASTQASKVTDYLLSFVRQEKPTPITV